MRMTNKSQLRFFELLKKFKHNEEFMELMDLLPVYRQHKEVDYKLRDPNSVKDFKTINTFDLLIFELETIEALENGGIA